MVTIQDWLESFRELPAVGISSSRTVGGLCKKGTGGRFLYAKVTLEFAPSEELLFEAHLSEEEAKESENEGWLYAICLGVIDVMLVHPETPITRFHCTIKAIESHPIDSSSQAFRLAARYATSEFLDQEKFVIR